MARRQRVLKRPKILADRTFNSELVSRLINRVMWDGKKTIATGIVERALNQASIELEVAPLELLEKAIENTRPQIETKAVRVGGANYQVPMEPYPARGLRMAITWIVDAARSIKGKAMEEKLATVIISSYKEEGPAVEKRNVVHSMAAANKAYAHLAQRAKRNKAKK
jgi:small subunit ribosomal protein S7